MTRWYALRSSSEPWRANQAYVWIVIGLSRRRASLRPSSASVKRSRVALGREIARELGDEEPAVGEDQDAEVARGLDEAGGGDRLAGRRRMAEAESADGAGVGAGELGLERARPR